MAEAKQSSYWDSRIIRRLDLLGALAALLILLPLVREEDVGWIGWVLLGSVVLVSTVVKWPYGAFVILFAMSAASRVQIELFGLNARPEHFAAGILSLALIFRWLSGKLTLSLDTLDFWVLAYAGVIFFSSAVTSPVPASTLRWALQTSLAIIPYFVVRLLVRDVTTLKRTFYIFLAVGFAESCFGTACFVSNRLFGTTVGIEPGQYGGVDAPFGSMFEANLFGAYSACCAVSFLALLNRDNERKGFALTGFLVTSAATIVSLSRAALIALVLVGAWLLFRNKSSRSGGRIKIAFLATAFVLLIMTTSAVGALLKQRFVDLFTSGLADETTITRYIVIVEAFKDVQSHPIIGLGASSLQLTFDFGQYMPEWAGQATWVGNITIRILHDTGAVGLIIFIGFFVSIWRRARPVLKRKENYSTTLLGLWAGVLIYGITFQATDGTILAFPWAHFGLLVSSAVILTAPNQGAVPQASAGEFEMGQQ